MTIGNDDRIRAFLADEERRAMTAAPSLDEAVGRLARRIERRPNGASQRLIVLMAATLLLVVALGTAIAVGSGILRLPLVLDSQQPADSDVVTVPPRGETTPVFLADGRPVFVVHHSDGTVSVVDAFSSHRAWGVEELNVWCPSTRQFVEGAHEAHFDEYGDWSAGPAPGGLETFEFQILESDAAGDPASIQVEQQMIAPSAQGGSGPERPPFCPAGDEAPGDGDLVSVTGAYTGETGMVVAHGLDGRQVWDSPAEAVAAAPTGWVAVRSTLHVAGDGFVQLCAQVVDDRCEGGVVVRGIDGIGLMLNVTRFDWVSGYEEPQVWLVQIHDGVIDNPAGVTNSVER